MKQFILSALITVGLMGCSTPDTYELVIQNVGLFDGYEDRGLVNIAINQDTIAAISTEELKGDSIMDGSGKYIIPGLVNAHVHASTIEQLQEGYPLGILTLLNMHTGLEDRELEWKKIYRDSMGYSTLYGAGHAATVPGGHPTQFSPDMETINDSLSIADWVAHRVASNVDYIKIIRENSEWMGMPGPPTLSYEQIGELIELAQQKGYKAVVHTSRAEEMTEIGKFKPDGFVHMVSSKEDYPPSEAYYQSLAASGAFVIPTAGITLKPMEATLPPPMAEWIRNNIMSSEEHAQVIRKMHEHGVLIVAGTDAQEGQMNFGEDYYLELDLYKMAGLSNEEILKTATGNAAIAFGLPIGELKVGSKANMLLLSDNPLLDIDNIKKVEQVWKNGKTK